jgi:hypothetical protein
MNFVDSLANCKTKFNGHGKLFEPNDEDSNALVVSKALKLSDKPY